MSDWNRRSIFKFVLSAVFIGAFAILFLPFYTQILLAAIFAFAIEPFLGRWLTSRRFRWKTSVALILLGMFVVLALPVSLLAYKTYHYLAEISRSGAQNTELFQKLIAFKGGILNLVNSLLERFGLSQQYDLSSVIDDGLNQAVNFLVGYSTGIASNIPMLLLGVFVFCAALYFFLAEARWVRGAFMKQRFLSATEAERLIAVLQRSCYSVIVTSLVIAVLQATIVALGSLILQAGDVAAVWGITLICAFIPVIGAGPVAITLGLYKWVMGDYGQAIGFLIVVLIATTADNVVRPYLLSSDGDLHPILSLLSIIGAILIFGMAGLFIGPVIALVATKIIPTLYSAEPLTVVLKDPSKKET